MVNIKMPGYEQKKREIKEMEEATFCAQAEEKKKQIIGEFVPKGPNSAEQMRRFRQRMAAISSGVVVAGVTQMALFAAGSALWAFDTASPMEEELGGVTYVRQEEAIYRGASYKQAIKNAYLFDDFRNGNEGGTWQAIAGLLAILISVGAGGRVVKKKIHAVPTKKTDAFIRSSRINEIYINLEKLKEYGVRTDVLIDGLGRCATTLVSKMSELDSQYLENLLDGGLETANWDVANAIVAGHLKAHPEDYNEIIKIIDESTMDQELVKKYGHGQVMSWEAAQVMRPLGKGDR